MTAREKTLGDLKRLIRIGWRAGEVPLFRANPPKKRLDTEIAKIIRRLERGGIVESDHHNHLLTFLTLKVEFEYAFGVQPRPGVQALGDALKRFGVADRFAKWQDKDRWFAEDRWPADTWKMWLASAPSPKAKTELLRRHVWALMAWTFYGEFVAGRVDEAADSLKKIDRLIDTQLSELRGGKPFGSRERNAEFIAQVYRTQGDSRAHETFLEAQDFAAQRLKRELGETDDLPLRKRAQAIQDALQYGTICTVRVLGGLGRLAVLQGQLTRARQLFMSCRTLLMPHAHERLLNVIDSHIEIVDRRLLEPGQKGWLAALKDLKTRHALFSTPLTGSGPMKKARHSQDFIDIDGARRCSLELARAYLDEAETSANDDDRRHALTFAHDWIGKFVETEGMCGENLPNPDQPTLIRFRHALLLGRYHVVSRSPIEVAEKCLADAERMLTEDHRHYCLDLIGVDRAQPDLLKGAILEAKGRLGWLPPHGTEHARDVFERLRSDASKTANRVLENEALMRLAGVELSVGLEDDALRHIRERNHLSLLVEDGFVDRSQKLMLQDDSKRNKLPVFQYESTKLDNVANRAEQELCVWVFRQSYNFGKAAGALNVSESTLRGILRAAGVPLRKPRAGR